MRRRRAPEALGCRRQVRGQHGRQAARERVHADGLRVQRVGHERAVDAHGRFVFLQVLRAPELSVISSRVARAFAPAHGALAPDMLAGRARLDAVHSYRSWSEDEATVHWPSRVCR